MQSTGSRQCKLPEGSPTFLSRQLNTDNQMIYNASKNSWVDIQGADTSMDASLFYLAGANGHADLNAPAGEFCLPSDPGINSLASLQSCAQLPGSFIIKPVDVADASIQERLFCEGVAPYIQNLQSVNCSKYLPANYKSYPGPGNRYLSVNMDNVAVSPADSGRVGTASDPSRYADPEKNDRFVKDVVSWLSQARAWANANSMCTTGNVHYRDNWYSSTPRAYSDYNDVTASLDITLDEDGFFAENSSGQIVAKEINAASYTDDSRASSPVTYSCNDVDTSPDSSSVR